MDKEDKEFMERNKLEDKFSAKRENRCIELMRPEVRALVDLPLDKKIEKSKEILQEAVSKYKRIGIGFSGGTDSLVTLHMLLQIKPDVHVVYVDTMREYPETTEFVNQTRQAWGIASFHVTRTEKVDRMEEYSKKYGFKTPEFMAEYCQYHKVVPALRMIKDLNLEAYCAGIRGTENEQRAQEQFFSPREKLGHMRIHPILFWTKENVLEYVKKYNIPTNPLYAKGFRSLGCNICSAPTDKTMAERAGRSIVRETIFKKLRDAGYN